MKKIKSAFIVALIALTALILAACTADEGNNSGPALSGTEIRSAALTLSGDFLNARVPSSLSEFSFEDDISVAEGATVSISKNQNGSEPFSGATPLSFGSNKFYVTVKNGDLSKTYTANIYRLSSYKITFNTAGGSEIAPIYADEDSVISAPENAPERILHIFDGWDYDFSNPIISDITVNAKWKLSDKLSDFDCYVTPSLIIIRGLKNDNAKNIVIPEGVTGIADLAFGGCENIETVTVEGNTLLTVGNKAFLNCKNMTSIVLPKSVTNMGSNVLSGCGKLESLTTPFVGSSPSLGTYGDISVFGYIFGFNEYYGSYEVPFNHTDGQGPKHYSLPISLKHVKVLGGSVFQGAFNNCIHIESIEFEAGVKMTAVPKRAFDACLNLKSIVLPAGVTAINDSAFAGCPELSRIYVRDGFDLNNITVGEYNDCVTAEKIYRYSESLPITDGNFWHYNESGAVTAWSKES